MSRSGSLLAFLTALVLTLPNLGRIVGSALPVVPLPLANIVRVVLVVALALVGGYLALTRVARQPGRQAWLSVTVFSIAIQFYPLAALWAAPAGLPGAAVAVGYTALCAVAALFALNVSDVDAKVVQSGLHVMALLVLALGLFTLVPRAAEARAVALRGARLELAPGVDVSAGLRRPDIYHIVFDGLGRPDVLESRYGIETASVRASLARTGAVLNEFEGAANYCQTLPSMASMLNMGYLDALGAWPDSGSMVPAYELIRKAGVFDLFKRLGYQIEFVGSSFVGTSNHPLADRCHCGLPTTGDLESALIAATPLRDLPIWRWLHWPHASKILRTLDTLEHPGTSPGPRLMFAHVLIPHPPFVFGADGRFQPPARELSLRDADTFEGTRDEYVSGYRNQALYVFSRLPSIVTSLVESSRAAGRDAVVVFTGDHGPRLMFNVSEARASDPSECFPIFWAERWPEGYTPGPIGSLVNLYRRLLRDAIGAEVDLVEDRFMLSSFATPYRWIVVPDSQVRGGRGATGGSPGSGRSAR